MEVHVDIFCQLILKMSVTSPTLTNEQGQHWGKNVGGEAEI